jgi:hypothetical protein
VIRNGLKLHSDFAEGISKSRKFSGPQVPDQIIDVKSQNQTDQG